MRTLFFHIERADLIFIIPATLIWILALLVTAYDFVQFQGMIYRFAIVNSVGLGLFSVGISLRLLSRFTLGKHYSYGLKPPERLIKHGVYRFVRHPIYLALFLYSLGIPLIFVSLYGFILSLGFIPLVSYRIRIEEKMLTEKFGDEYKEYVGKTKKIIPFIY